MVVLVGKREVFDVDAMWELSKHDKIPKTVRNQLRMYRKRAVNGNSVNITYDYGKEWRVFQRGRIAPDPYLGLAVFPREVRAALAKKYYWDLDIENAQPVILCQFAEKNGVQTPALSEYCKTRPQVFEEIMKSENLNRSEAKDICIAVLFGGTRNQHSLLPRIHDELVALSKSLLETNGELYLQCAKVCGKREGKKNPLASMLAILAQEEERKVLYVIDRFLSSKGRSLDVLIYDGGLVRMLEGETEFPVELMRELEEFIFKETGYQISLQIKPLSHSFVFKEDSLIAESVLVDDAYAAEHFAEVCGDRLRKIGDVVWGFNSKTGMWNTNLSPLVEEFKEQLVFRQATDKGIQIHNYGGCVKKIAYLLTLLPNYVEERELNVETSIGKLLFADGIYDFNTRTFTEGFNPEIVFKHRIKRSFPRERNSELETLVNKILFQDPYLAEQKEQADFFKTAIARAVYGDYRAKRFYITVGSPNCGRGLLTDALKKTFEGFVGTFNANSLLYNPKASEDDEKKNAWLLALSDCRLAISNEVSMTKQYIDGNKLKAASGGGDEIKGRFNHKDAVEFVNKATLLLLTNDIPSIKPPDEGLLNRVCVNELKKTYKPTPEEGNPYQALEDRTLKDKFNDCGWKDALFWILEEEWAAFAQTDRKAEKPDLVKTAIQEWIETGATIKSLLEQGFTITKNPEEFVTSRELISFLKQRGCVDSETKIGRELGKLGLKGDVRKVGGVAKRVWIGVKKQEEENLMED